MIKNIYFSTESCTAKTTSGGRYGSNADDEQHVVDDELLHRRDDKNEAICQIWYKWYFQLFEWLLNIRAPKNSWSQSIETFMANHQQKNP